MYLKKRYLPYILPVLIIVSCVPSRKYEELKSKKQSCADENASLKAQNRDLEEKNNELGALNVQLGKKVNVLQQDTAVLGNSLNRLKKNYDNINTTYELLLDKNNQLLSGNKTNTEKLMSQLQEAQENIQTKEDALRALDNSLQKKEVDLNQLSLELQKREKKVNELESMIASKDDVVTSLKNKVKEALLGFENNGLTIEQKNGKVYVSLDESLLFASGSYKVESKGIEVLKKLANVLAQNEDINVLVEGHTDDVPMNGSGAIADNWDLSVKRATSVVKIITTNKYINPKRLTAAGKGEHLPIDISDTKEARKRNRRTEIILTPKLDELLKLLEGK